MATIATVQNVRGDVFAVDANGIARRVKDGDTLQEGEVLVTGPGGTADLDTGGGKLVKVPEQQTVAVDGSVVGSAGAGGSALTQTEFAQKVIKALASSGDLNALLEQEATAAGVAGGGGNDGGSSFVQLLRISEGLGDPRGYEFLFNPAGSPGESNDANPFDPAATPPLSGLPFAVNDSASAAENTAGVVVPMATGALTGGVLTNDLDADSAAGNLSVTAIRTGAEGAGGTAGAVGATLAGTYGTLTLYGNGTYAYVLHNGNAAVNALNVGDTLTDVFTYTLSDGTNADQADLLITINGTNDGPVAVADVVGGFEDTAITITGATLFGADGTGAVNDSDVDNAAFTSISIAALPVSVGTLMLDGAAVTLNQVISLADIAANKLTFVPTANASGPASFNYTVSDGAAISNLATVTLNIAAVNDAPVAVDDTLNGNQDANLTITSASLFGTDGTGAANDSDIDNAAFTSITVTALPDGGEGGVGTLLLDGAAVTQGQVITIADIAANKLTFAPNRGANGATTFKYTVSDGVAGSGEATVTINIDGNEAPVVENAMARISEEGLAGANPDDTPGGGADTGDSSSVTGNIVMSDTEGDSLSVTLSQPGAVVTSGGQSIAWSLSNANQTLTGTIGGDAPVTIMTVTVTNAGVYNVILSGQLDHPDGDGENLLPIDFGVQVSDGSNTTFQTLTVTVEDDSPIATITDGLLQNADGGEGGPAATLFGNLASMGADGGSEGSIVWTTEDAPEGLSSFGQTVEYDNDGATLIAFVSNYNRNDAQGPSGASFQEGDNVVFTLTANADGSYKLEQFRSLDIDYYYPSIAPPSDESSPPSIAPQLEASTTLTFEFTATDVDGDPVSGSLTVLVQDGEFSDLTGGDGNDALAGAGSYNTLDGGEGNDILTGGRGDDDMTGGNGADTFRWALGDQGYFTAVDTITDFGANGENDKLDLRDLLQGEHSAGAAPNVTDYLHFTYDSGTNTTTIDVKTSGADPVDQQIVLTGFDATEGGAVTGDAAIVANMITQGKLIVDP